MRTVNLVLALAKVASGAYNKEIDAKITEIKKTCGLE